MNKKNLCLLACFLHFICASQNISGVINIYAPVTQVNCNNVTVTSSSGFSVGDRVLLIQMKGATVDQTNTSSFGSVLNYHESGNYEFATISSIASNTIYFQYKTINLYNTSAFVQLIKVPTYTNATVTSALTCLPWNGTMGGVLAFEVSNTLTLNSNIDVSGKGFRGGVACTNPDGGCGAGYSDYSYQVSSGFGAEKGESICIKNVLMDGGRGAWANGGGGGNKHNSGGGGGGNFSSGGQGGNEANFCPVTPVGGVGGYNFNYSLGKIFFGGGGGCSDNNNMVGTTGTNGGGIIIIKASSVNGNNDSIISNGINQTYISNSIGDGAGGGGAGGTILLAVGSYLSAVKIAANGGDGGDQFTSYPSCFGPGGGGGTGLVYFSSSTLPANANYTTQPGTAGIDLNPSSSCYNTSYGAQAGQTAVGAMYNLILPEGTQNFQVNLGPDTNLCVTPTIILNASVSSATYTWSTGATTQTISVNTSGTYWVNVSQGGCTATDTISVTLPVTPTAGSNSPLCAGQTLNLTTSNISGATYNWAGPNSFTASTQNPNINGVSITASGIYSVTATVGTCILPTVTTTVSVSPIPPSPIAGSNSPVCAGSVLNLTVSNIAGAIYNWMGPNSFISSVQNPTITAAAIAASGIYSVTATVGGCAGSAGTVTVVVVNSSSLSLLPNDTNICGTSSLTINAMSGLPFYNWSTGATTTSITVNFSGTYWLTSLVNNCNLTDSIKVAFIDLSSLDIGTNITTCDTFVNLSANIIGANYLWSTGAASQQIIVTQSGNYSVIVSKFHCSNQDTANVLFLSNSHIKVPNIVTPNGDGINENMALLNLGNTAFETFKFIIYNRWGIKMFETNTTNFIWENNKHLSEADDGTYFWIMEYSDYCEKSKQLLKGFLTIIK